MRRQTRDPAAQSLRACADRCDADEACDAFSWVFDGDDQGCYIEITDENASPDEQSTFAHTFTKIVDCGNHFNSLCDAF